MRSVKLLVCLGVFCAYAIAQQAGSLSGRVTDQAGAGVPNAIIVLTQEGSGTAQRVVTAADGSFSLANLGPGTYRVEVESAGMRRSGQSVITITESAPSQVEITLGENVGAAGQQGTVEIQAISPMVQTDSAEVSRSYRTRQVRSLPILDRQYQELISLMPGITPPVISSDPILNPERQRSFSVNGLPPWANSQFQDGAFGNEAFTNNAIRIAPVESIQQLNIRTSNYNAEFGFSGGSWSNVVTRPGTNGLHGSLFFFNTNNFFATRHPLNVAGNPQPRFNQHQFGGTAGGALIPDRLFIFGSYEGRLRRGNELQFATVPTAAFRSGVFADVPGVTIYNPATGLPSGVGRTAFAQNQVPTTAFNQASVAILNALPLPNQPGFGNNLVGNAPLIEDTHRLDGKIDHRFTDRSYGFFRYGFTHGDLERGSILGPLGSPANAGLRNHNAVASLSQGYTPNFLAEYRVGYSRYRNAIRQSGGLGTLGGTLAAAGFPDGLPQINISGFTPLGQNAFYPDRAVNNTYDGAANWVWHNGFNKLKFGVQVVSIDANGFSNSPFSPYGSFTFGPGATSVPTGFNSTQLAANAFAAFLTGAPTQAGASTFFLNPTYTQRLYSGYITDTINLWQKFHLELGVRYDVFSPLETRQAGGAAFFDPTTGLVRFGAGGSDTSDYDFNNIAPRIGFVFTPVQRLAFRGGYGVHYFPVPFSLSGLNQTAIAGQTGLAGGFGTTQFRIPSVSTPPGFGDPEGTGIVSPNQPYFVTPADAQTPYAQTFNFMIQADLTNGFLMDIGYVGVLGRQLPYSRGLNIASPGTGLAGLPGFATGFTAGVSERTTGLNSNYNALQVNLTKRIANGFSFTGAYTWSKSLDRGFDLANPFTFGGDNDPNYGVSDWDRRHILAISHVWTLPWGPGTGRFNQGAAAWILGGWEINGILRWASGAPYSVTADPLFCACPGIGSVPATLVGSGADLNGAANFSPSLFAAPAPGTFGSLNRNAFRGPDLFNYNMALFKTFPIAENYKLELRGEVYNLTNTTNFTTPVSVLGDPNFGRATQLYNNFGGRQFQVGARILF